MSAARRSADRGIPRCTRTWGAYALTFALGACSAESSPPPVTVTDSAGIPITLSPDLDVTYATLAPEPVVSLGGPNAEGATQFYRITNVQMDGDGRIWVSDWQSGELRVFDVDGSHLMTRGRLGEGPGEFMGIRLLGPFADDSVVVADQRTGRRTVYDGGGELVRSERLEIGDDARPRPFDVYPDGSVLGQVPEVRRADALEPGTVLADHVRLMRFSSEEAPRPAADEEAGPLWLWTGQDLVPLPFTVNAAFDLSGRELHFAAGPAFRVRVYQSGRVVRIYGVDRPEQPVTQADVDTYVDFVEEAYPEEARPALLSAMDHPAAPSILPAYTSLVMADDGTAWAGRFSPDLPWDVYGPRGELLGHVRIPPDLYPMSIRDGRVAGVWRDELGVEHVRVHAVER